MHPEYVYESLNRTLDTCHPGHFSFLCNFAAEPDFLDYAEKAAETAGNEKLASICQTIRTMAGERYRHPTQKQKAAIAHFLMSLKPVPELLCDIYGQDMRDLMDKERARYDEIEGVAVCKDWRVGFGLMATFIVESDAPEVDEGATFPISQQGLRKYRLIQNGALRAQSDGLVTVDLGGQIVAVTTEQARELEKQEVDVPWWRPADQEQS